MKVKSRLCYYKELTALLSVVLSNKMKNEESEPTAFSNTGTLNRDSFSGVMGQRPEYRRLKGEVGSEEIECDHPQEI